MEYISQIFFCMFVLTVPQTITADMPSVLIITPGWWYQFRAGDNSYCPMTEGQATTNNAKIVTWDACYVDTTHSWWKAIKGSQTGTFTLMNQKSKLCMTVGINMQDTGNNSPVVQYECKNPPPATQLWSYELLSYNNNDYMRLKSGGRCISYDLNTPKGGAMYMYDCGCCDRWTNQFFKAAWYGFVNM